MPIRDAAAVGVPRAVPSMLDLVRLSPRRLFPPGGVELYRHIALLTEMAPGDEVLDVACGQGISLEYFVREFGVEASGVDADAFLIEQAEARSREVGLTAQLHYRTGPSNALPHRDAIFDVAVGEIGLAGDGDAAEAVRELVRVTKPGGVIALVQLVWKAPVDEERQRVLAEHLGARPRMLVEWKRLLKEAGVEELHTEDWSDTDTAFRPAVVKPFPDFAELFSMPEKVGILRRVWRQWGWRGLRSVLQRERAVHRLLTQERILGLNLLKGRKAEQPREATDLEAGARGGVRASGGARTPRPVPGAPSVESRTGPEDRRDSREGRTGTEERRRRPEERSRAREGGADAPAADSAAADPHATDPSDPHATDPSDPQTEGLPLFGRRAGDVRDPAGRGK